MSETVTLNESLSDYIVKKWLRKIKNTNTFLWVSGNE